MFELGSPILSSSPVNQANGMPPLGDPYQLQQQFGVGAGLSQGNPFLGPGGMGQPAGNAFGGSNSQGGVLPTSTNPLEPEPALRG